MDKMKNPAVVGAGQYDGNGAVLSRVMPGSAVRWLFGGRGQATAPCPGAIDEIREKQSTCNISYR